MKQRQKKSESNWLLGKINWFDPVSERGSILGNDGNMYRIQDFSSVERNQRLRANIQVEFKLVQSSQNPIIESVRLLSKERLRSQSKIQNASQKESAA